MSDLPQSQANAMLAEAFVPGNVYYLSLHTSDPGTTGANEISYGSSSRQIIVFNIPSGGRQTSTDGQTFSGLPGPPTCTNFGIWSLATGGTYEGGGILEAPITLANIIFNVGGIVLEVQ